MQNAHAACDGSACCFLRSNVDWCVPSGALRGHMMAVRLERLMRTNQDMARSMRHCAHISAACCTGCSSLEVRQNIRNLIALLCGRKVSLQIH